MPDALTDLQSTLKALIDAHAARVRLVEQVMVAHNDSLAALLAKVEAEIARVPNVGDIKALVAKVPD